jgi:archaellum component FlaC
MQIETVKVEGTNFVRELKSMGLSNLDTFSKNDYYSKVRMMKSQKDEINNIRKDVNSLRTEMQDIKSLLEKILNKGTNG